MKSEGTKFISSMERLKTFEVRFHCPFHGVDISYKDERAKHSMTFFEKWVDRIATVGGRHMTIHIGREFRSQKRV